MPNLTKQTLPKIISQHADEVAFLYTQRKNASLSYIYYISDFAAIDNRLNANLDGLLISGESAWQFLQAGLEFEAPGEVFAAAVFCIATNDSKKLEQIFEIAGDKTELLEAIADAFVWLPFNHVHHTLENLFHLKGHARRYVVIAALAGHGQRINQLDQYLIQALQSENIPLIQRTLLAIGELGIHELSGQLLAALKHDDEHVKFAAAWSATRFGMAGGMEAMKKYVSHAAYANTALQFVAMQKDRKDTAAILRELYLNDDTRRYSIIGLGYFGNPLSIPKLIEAMGTPVLARIAGAAFSHITGFDLLAMKMDAEPPADFNAGPTENAEDENIAMDADEDLPWPDMKKIADWWQSPTIQEQYQQSTHYFLGAPLSRSQLQKGLRQGNQVQRQFAALLLATQDRTSALFNVLSPSQRQLELLA